ncbi:MAG: ankyrin repeat domain-containing protein [Acidobacteria bacterium]|nr:ankyrin repeat domain-containing protein [Acidobacteriota bacterium]
MEIPELFSPLLTTFQNDDPEAFDQALKANLDVLHQHSETGDTLLLILCHLFTHELALPPKWGSPTQLEMIRKLCALGADPNAENAAKWKPLHVAAMTGQIALAEILIHAGSNLNGKLMGDPFGSPLALALFYAQTHVAKTIAQPPTPNNLRHAAGLGQPIDLFFQTDGSLVPSAITGLSFYRPFDFFPEWQRTYSRQEVVDEALTWAARNNQVGSMAELIDRGAELNNNVYRGTPLLWAVYGDRVEAAAWLLDHGADPDLRHDFGGSEHGKSAVALHLAAQFNGVKCLRLLLERGADPTIRDAAFNGTPLDWAEFGQAHEAVEILRKAAQN